MRHEFCESWNHYEYWCKVLQPDALPDANLLSRLLRHAEGTVTLFYPQVTEDNLPNGDSRGRTAGHSLMSYPGHVISGTMSYPGQCHIRDIVTFIHSYIQTKEVIIFRLKGIQE